MIPYSWAKITLHGHYGTNFMTTKLPKCLKNRLQQLLCHCTSGICSFDHWNVYTQLYRLYKLTDWRLLLLSSIHPRQWQFRKIHIQYSMETEVWKGSYTSVKYTTSNCYFSCGICRKFASFLQVSMCSNKFKLSFAKTCFALLACCSPTEMHHDVKGYLCHVQVIWTSGVPE